MQIVVFIEVQLLAVNLCLVCVLMNVFEQSAVAAVQLLEHFCMFLDILWILIRVEKKRQRFIFLGDYCQGDRALTGQVQRGEIIEILGVGSISHFEIRTRLTAGTCWSTPLLK